MQVLIVIDAPLSLSALIGALGSGGRGKDRGCRRDWTHRGVEAVSLVGSIATSPCRREVEAVSGVAGRGSVSL